MGLWSSLEDFSDNHWDAAAEWFRKERRWGLPQIIAGVISLLLSLVTLKPLGAMALPTLPAANNNVWLTFFVLVTGLCTLWATVRMYRKNITKVLERYPDLFRFYVLIDSALLLASGGLGSLYILLVLRGPDGCQDTTVAGCPSAMAITAFDLIWALVEVWQFGLVLYRYCKRNQEFEKDNRRGERETWIRGFQFFFTALSVIVAVFLFLPSAPGITVVDGVRNGKSAWLLAFGAVACGICCVWHGLLWFSYWMSKFHTSYRLYVFYMAMESLVGAALAGIGLAYTFKFLNKGAPCGALLNQGCLAVLVMAALVCLASCMQVWQLAWMWNTHGEHMPQLAAHRERVRTLRKDKKGKGPMLTGGAAGPGPPGLMGAGTLPSYTWCERFDKRQWRQQLAVLVQEDRNAEAAAEAKTRERVVERRRERVERRAVARGKKSQLKARRGKLSRDKEEVDERQVLGWAGDRSRGRRQDKSRHARPHKSRTCSRGDPSSWRRDRRESTATDESESATPGRGSYPSTEDSRSVQRDMDVSPVSSYYLSITDSGNTRHGR